MLGEKIDEMSNQHFVKQWQKGGWQLVHTQTGGLPKLWISKWRLNTVTVNAASYFSMPPPFSGAFCLLLSWCDDQGVRWRFAWYQPMPLGPTWLALYRFLLSVFLSFSFSSDLVPNSCLDQLSRPSTLSVIVSIPTQLNNVTVVISFTFVKPTHILLK